MKKADVRFEAGFHVLTGNVRSQAAVMVIAPGEKEGGEDNRHKGADQWLYVESGEGEAKVNGEVFALAKGLLVLIEHGDRHEVRNTGRSPLRTLNFYTPSAYTDDGDELPAGKSG